MTTRLLVIPALLSGAVLFSACGSGSTPTTASATTTTTPAITGVTKNLVVTATVRKSIFDAAAAYHQLPPSDYVSLERGTTYYAFDPTTHRFYAAAGLIPSPHSLKAQIGAQDDGGYNLFTRTTGTNTWTVLNDGLGGAEGSTCPLKIPAAVLKVWNWKANSCFPPA